jgi:DNA mismatch repair protein MutL
MLMVGRYPRAFIFLEMPPDRVDVNVHPTKAEVRFRDRDQVFRAVGSAVRRALLAHQPIPTVDALSRQLDGDSFWRRDRQPGGVDLAWEMSTGLVNVDSVNNMQSTDTLSENHLSSNQSVLPAVGVPVLRLVGQVAQTYVIAEGPNGLYLIDQHAAHERILFEQMMTQRKSSIPSQVLLTPATVDLSRTSADLLEEQLPALADLGFQVEKFGRETFLVRAIPTLLMGLDPVSALKVLVEDFEEDETPLEKEMEAKMIARVCKRAAIKAGQALSNDEQAALLRDLEACQSPRTCPHGRPTMIHLSVGLLERQFGRKGAR